MNVLSLFDGIASGRVALDRAGIKVDNYYASEVDKYAIKIAMKNYPDTIQVGDVTKLTASMLPKIDLLIGGSPCFTKGTRVLTKDGYKDISEVCIGDYVMNHICGWDKVKNIGNKQSNIIKFRSQGSLPVNTTINHPYYSGKKIITNGISRIEDIKFRKLSELSKEYCVGMPIINENNNYYDLSDDECYIVGRYIADGHTRKDYKGHDNNIRRQYQLILSIGETKLDDFSNIKLHYSCYKHTKSVYRVVFSNKRLVDIVEKECGIGAINKVISPTLLQLPKDKLKILLKGYTDGDGYISNNKCKCTTISIDLAQSLCMAVAKAYNIGASIFYNKLPKTHVIEGRTVNQHDTYSIEFVENTVRCKYVVTDKYIWYPIREITELGIIDTVYNIEVENSHTYTANNIAVHNCQGFSFAGKQLNFEDPRSKLIFEYLRLLRELNPTYFLLENVKMKKEYQDAISEFIGSNPYSINSALVSAQNRKRLYWTNIPGITQPEDKGILLKDIVHETFNEILFDINVDKFNVNPSGNGMNGFVYSVNKFKSNTLTTNKGEGQKIAIPLSEYIVPFDDTLKILDKEVQKGKIGYYRQDSQANRVYYIHGKSVTLCGEAGGGAAKMGQYLFGCITPNRINKRQNGQRFSEGKKFYTLTAQDKHGVLIEGYIRKLTSIECERLQTIPDNYTEGISNSQRYKCLGNGWTVDIIVHILNNIKE